MALSNLELTRMSECLRNHWQRANPRFATGNDPRSSDNMLLLLLYGSLHKAAGYGWQNAGRTLIDKTYLRILAQCTQLDMHGLSADELAARLDGFIRREVAPRWETLSQSAAEKGPELAQQLLVSASDALFDGSDECRATSQILFYLCPRLPILPNHPQPVAQTDQLRELPIFARPQCFAGDTQQQVFIRQLIESSDWWPRRVLSAWHLHAQTAPMPA
ncbi:hypothetical protein [Pseudomonas marincola]|uniref:hypothetical protein n=1 Tax=Pseudomonas marincola TaxID=437900 RepID=UPI0008EFBD80|nr:hypothetical protein [Pseudomonas marincola]SFU09904.1 hypothetical protein SAMN05216264_111120 [Pseudomonas marincola]